MRQAGWLLSSLRDHGLNAADVSSAGRREFSGYMFCKGFGSLDHVRHAGEKRLVAAYALPEAGVRVGPILGSHSALQGTTTRLLKGVQARGRWGAGGAMMSATFILCGFAGARAHLRHVA